MRIILVTNRQTTAGEKWLGVSVGARLEGEVTDEVVLQVGVTAQCIGKEPKPASRQLLKS